jgi:hypothetical protein
VVPGGSKGELPNRSTLEEEGEEDEGEEEEGEGD